MDDKRVGNIDKISVKEMSNVSVPSSAAIVFDWDNTLKQYDIANRSLKPGVSKNVLQKWKSEKHCQLFIISAIRPSKMNLETLLIEVGRLDLEDLFTEPSDQIQVVPDKYARKGNIIICGYDKAETFLDLYRESRTYSTDDRQLNDLEVDGDTEDSAVSTFETYDRQLKDLEVGGDMVDSAMGTLEMSKRELGMNILFFDDEEVNIDNFSRIVKNSQCFHIV